jgi:hypothetical protein
MKLSDTFRTSNSASVGVEEDLVTSHDGCGKYSDGQWSFSMRRQKTNYRSYIASRKEGMRGTTHTIFPKRDGFSKNGTQGVIGICA